ncbi:MAG: ABC transporter permease [Prevotella sp.]|nr:ABC transporter permease [Prevotella sp.]
MASLPLFLAHRIYQTGDDQKQVSRPAIRIATLGVAIGLAVMIVTVSVIMGFKHTIRDKVVGFGSHIQIESLTAHQTAVPTPISIDDSLMRQLKAVPNVQHVARYTMTQGILKTDDDFMGVAFKGIGKDYNTTFLQENLKEGKMPQFGKDKGKSELLVSRIMADKLQLKVGDRVFSYFINNDGVRVRRFTISGIYETQMRQFDQSLCFTDYQLPIRLNNWEADQCSGAELLLTDFDGMSETAEQVQQLANHKLDKYGEALTALTILEEHPQIFSWLSLLDINVWIILILMVCVAGFTMISGLLIIILERTQMIGLLKALGARNKTIRHTFLWFATFIIGRGLLLGDIIGIGLVVLQQQTSIVKLDPASYYVDTAPVELNIAIVAALNIATLMVSVLVLVAPSYLVAHIHPAKAMHFE